MYQRTTDSPVQGLSAFASLLAAAELVVFDFDGVIADSEVISLNTLHEALSDYGVELTPEETRTRFLGTSLETIRAYVSRQTGKDAGSFAQLWEDALFARFEAELTPVPHVFDLIDWLDRHQTRYCIASSGTFTRIETALRAMGVEDRFDHVFSAEQVARGKPAPDLFELAGTRLGVDPDACLVIEDSPHGVHAAVAAQMRAVGFSGGQHLSDLQVEHGAALMAAGAEMILPSFEGIAEWTIEG